jgi:outer membrane protein assembly factor BamB
LKPPLSGAPRPAGWHGSARHGSHDLGANTSYPLIVGGRVFVAALHGSVYGPVLYAFDLATGAELWSRRLGGDASITVAAPILVGSTVYTAVSSPGRVIALDADTGEILDEELVASGVPTLADDGGSGGLGAGA